jgi:hypothetical protein
LHIIGAGDYLDHAWGTAKKAGGLSEDGSMYIGCVSVTMIQYRAADEYFNMGTDNFAFLAIVRRIFPMP